MCPGPPARRPGAMRVARRSTLSFGRALIVTLTLKSDGGHKTLFPYRESSRTLLLTITLPRGGHGNDSGPAGNDAGEGAQAVSVRLGGGRPVARAHGAVHGGQHQ